MTAISGVEVACWDLIGKACRQPVYRLAGRPLSRPDPGVCQRLVWRGALAGRICREGQGGRGQGLSGTQVRPVRHRLEDA